MSTIIEQERARLSARRQEADKIEGLTGLPKAMTWNDWSILTELNARSDGGLVATAAEVAARELDYELPDGVGAIKKVDFESRAHVNLGSTDQTKEHNGAAIRADIMVGRFGSTAQKETAAHRYYFETLKGRDNKAVMLWNSMLTAHAHLRQQQARLDPQNRDRKGNVIEDAAPGKGATATRVDADMQRQINETLAKGKVKRAEGPAEGRASGGPRGQRAVDMAEEMDSIRLAGRARDTITESRYTIVGDYAKVALDVMEACVDYTPEGKTRLVTPADLPSLEVLEAIEASTQPPEWDLEAARNGSKRVVVLLGSPGAGEAVKQYLTSLDKGIAITSIDPKVVAAFKKIAGDREVLAPNFVEQRGKEPTQYEADRNIDAALRIAPANKKDEPYQVRVVPFLSADDDSHRLDAYARAVRGGLASRDAFDQTGARVDREALGRAATTAYKSFREINHEKALQLASAYSTATPEGRHFLSQVGIKPGVINKLGNLDAQIGALAAMSQTEPGKEKLSQLLTGPEVARLADAFSVDNKAILSKVRMAQLSDDTNKENGIATIGIEGLPPRMIETGTISRNLFVKGNPEAFRTMGTGVLVAMDSDPTERSAQATKAMIEELQAQGLTPVFTPARGFPEDVRITAPATMVLGQSLDSYVNQEAPALHFQAVPERKAYIAEAADGSTYAITMDPENNNRLHLHRVVEDGKGGFDANLVHSADIKAVQRQSWMDDAKYSQLRGAEIAKARRQLTDVASRTNQEAFNAPRRQLVASIVANGGTVVSTEPYLDADKLYALEHKKPPVQEIRENDATRVARAAPIAAGMSSAVFVVEMASQSPLASALSKSYANRTPVRVFDPESALTHAAQALRSSDAYRRESDAAADRAVTELRAQHERKAAENRGLGVPEPAAPTDRQEQRAATLARQEHERQVQRQLTDNAANRFAFNRLLATADGRTLAQRPEMGETARAVLRNEFAGKNVANPSLTRFEQIAEAAAAIRKGLDARSSAREGKDAEAKSGRATRREEERA